MLKIQNAVAKVVKDKGWKKQPTEQKFLLLTEEIGEFAKAVRKSVGMKIGSHSQDPKAKEEAADVMFMLLAVCNDLKIDIEKELNEKLRVIKSRK